LVNFLMLQKLSDGAELVGLASGGSAGGDGGSGPARPTA
jgi:hypothetical protein